jgi:curved DNA-binding protein CbpA
MDYQAEQQTEVEALAAIYMDDFEVVEQEPLLKYQIRVNANGGSGMDGDGDGASAFVELTFTCPAEYPMVAPDISVTNSSGFTKKDESELKEFLLLQIDAMGLIGQVMGFSLVSEALQWMTDCLDRKRAEEQQRESELEAIARQKEEEEKRLAQLTRFDLNERAVLEGTPVTKENFIAWKLQFDEEMRLKKEAESLKQSSSTKNGKLTGKQYFELFSVNDTMFDEMPSLTDAELGLADE